MLKRPMRGAGQAPGLERSELSQAVTLGLACAVGMAVFTFAGYWVDQRRGGGISFTLTGMVLGLAYGAYEVWKVIRLLNEQAQSATRERTGVAPKREDPPDSSAKDPDE
jgi:hypothetical protein